MSIAASAVTFLGQQADLSNLKLANYTIDPSAIGAKEVVLRAIAAPINPSDVLQARGGYVPPPYLHDLDANTKQVYVGGNEGVFEVTHVGSDVTSVQPGDRVIPSLSGFGTWRTALVAAIDDPRKTAGGKVDAFVKVPADLKEAEAATLTINPATAYQIFHNYHKLEAGDWIVQNAGTSQVSQYITQLAKSRGVKTLSVVRDGKSKAELDKLYELGATSVIDESTLLSSDFAAKLKEIVGDGHVRLALNSVGGATASALFGAVGQDGYFISYGASSGDPQVTINTSQQLVNNISVVPYWLTGNSKRDPQSRIDTVKEVIKLYEQGVFRIPDVQEIKLDGDIASFFVKAIQSPGKKVVLFD
ncbi:NAD(P)-binding protein [Suhomyces tanzawaensis NRRL Y-17324]|uniref:enoyl-[acyl-carrier-protein] reductase n=1 Tax=Suhomyces tanzawaensis NRRL Y-17324 TaxID=984487 RepID=A0A1E4SEI3_9ASCO|nr:NAD(P)-binding protein [Suhomyces tanzawaensis NRRL Y-17324]ODV77931.1 NAD(P)-binding protein [Suhomyces tanzawaensis NRRL Y-17324]